LCFKKSAESTVILRLFIVTARLGGFDVIDTEAVPFLQGPVEVYGYLGAETGRVENPNTTDEDRSKMAFASDNHSILLPCFFLVIHDELIRSPDENRRGAIYEG